MQPDAHLDADDHVAVGVGHLDGVDGVHQAQVAALAHHDAVGEAEDAGVRHVQVGQDAHLGRLDHVLAETGEVAGARAAGVDRGRDAGGAAELLRVDAERGAAPVDVGVQVDQAGRDDRSRHVAHHSPGAALQLGADLGDLAAREGHVAHGIELLRGIDHASSPQDEIVGHGSPRCSLEACPLPSRSTDTCGAATFIAGMRTQWARACEISARPCLTPAHRHVMESSVAIDPRRRPAHSGAPGQARGRLEDV